jgi:hypothetical protein
VRRQEVSDIESDDHAGPRRDGGCENMAIGQRQARDQWLVAGNEAVGHGAIHRAAGRLELFPRQVGPFLDDCAHPLPVHVVAPARTKKARLGKSDDDTAQASAKEDVGVEKYRESGDHPASPPLCWVAS